MNNDIVMHSRPAAAPAADGLFLQSEHVRSHGVDLRLLLSPHVKPSDYYTEFMLDVVAAHLEKQQNPSPKVLEVGTGRGFAPIILAKLFPGLTAVGTDIVPASVSLAEANLALNSVADRIQIRLGNMFEPVGEDERFDVIFAALPQIPLSATELAESGLAVDAFHVTTSCGGSDGHAFIDPFIANGAKFLTDGGVIAHVQAEFSDVDRTIDGIERAGLVLQSVVTRPKYLDETTLTKLLRPHLESRGFKFRRDRTDALYFDSVTVVGQKAGISV